MILFTSHIIIELIIICTLKEKLNMAPQVGEAPMPMQVNDDDDNNNNQITEKVTKKERTTKDLAFYQLLSYADGFDWSMMVFASLGSVVHGLAQPVGYLLLGKALNAFGDNINDTHAMVSALYKVCCIHNNISYTIIAFFHFFFIFKHSFVSQIYHFMNLSN